jgi:hypothetical protein
MADEALAAMSRTFAAAYAPAEKGGRPSIPPERLLKALVLMSLYTVRSEISRLSRQWATPTHAQHSVASTHNTAEPSPATSRPGAALSSSSASIAPPLPASVALDSLDDFDRVQLEHVIRICRQSRSLSEAGRTLFAASRKKKTARNDADRLKKYLARFDLSFDNL